MMLYEAIKYYECGLYPIPLYSPKMINRGEVPEWYEEKRKEIMDISKEVSMRNREIEEKGEDDENIPYRHDIIETEERITALNIETCKTALPIVDIHEYQLHRPNIDDVRSWFSRYPEANIGLLIGQNYELTIVDVDKKIASAYHQMSGRKEILPIVETDKGFQYYFIYTTPEDLKDKTEDTGVKILDMPYVVAPPSIHGSGFVYKWRRPIATRYCCCDYLWMGRFILDMEELKYKLEETTPYCKCISCKS